jgi:protein arginine kinase
MFEDKVFRSLGILLSARVISSEESHKLLSDVRLGIDMGIIKHIGIDAVNEIIVLTQPANLQASAGKALSPVERDVGRANLIRSKLGRMDS